MLSGCAYATPVTHTLDCAEVSVVHVHTSHELVQSSVHTSKHESFTFIVHHLNSELVHSSVSFFFLNYCKFFRRTSFLLSETLSDSV